MTDKYKYFQNILFTKIRNVKSPERANLHDAGIDFYVPEYDDDFREAFVEKNQGFSHTFLLKDALMLLPGERVLIPSGVKVWIENKESALIAANKSGVAHQKGLIFTAQVVDSDYTGEIHIGVYNTNKFPVSLKPGDKLIQFIHTPLLLTDLCEVSKEEYQSVVDYYGTDRGEGGFGSTNQPQNPQGANNCNCK